MGKKTIYHTRLGTRREAGLGSSLIKGLAAMLFLAGPRRTSFRRSGDDVAKALRGDFVRIGMDMRKAAARVVSREDASR